ncbi:AMP-binding protein [Arthrobacter sp. EPSL27]|uniref:AMP-binding protein n=1 Tax=Arthrobacter sp. EPSL27 TaxID=1745378 RepID=UPI00074A8C75|nr:AMP-binding protein [Arthrobacter sp. EPSL27]KUM32514.1 AMP-dependent synthetase [Arthrobacter sp. EPSL27]
MIIEPVLTEVSFAAGLAAFGDRTAVCVDGQAVSYSELADRVDAAARSLGTVRRLVALEADNSLPSLVVYLAALSAGHPLLILPTGGGRAAESLVAAYDPDVLARVEGGDAVLEERREGTRHALHPELALLVSTSGSTGSPKLVRLSGDAVQANAAAIAEYLQLRPEDRAATTLPLSYCYGMSVVNSHLSVGATVVLTDLSVVDPCFWDLVRTERVTSFAAVPYTFELLERAGFADMDLPSLRYITQAGGRLDPDRVRAYAQLGRRRGWDLFVMYGQTEATARMAYLPPDVAAEHPQAVGIPIPGGQFRLAEVPGLDERELVYSGPNVMLGYAETPADLELGRTVTELHTGDLARRTAEGLYEIVGRRSRFVKIVGLRVDLGQVERILADLGMAAAAAGQDGRVVAAVESAAGESGHGLALIAKTVAQEVGVPRPAIHLHPVAAIPRLGNGKPDYPAILALHDSSAESSTGGGPADAPDDVRGIYADVLELEDIGDADTFVSLGGDSLSYVAASVRLERALGDLPRDWHLLPVGELERARTAAAVPDAAADPGAAGPVRAMVQKWRNRLLAPMETGIVLRAVAIVFIISTHIRLFSWEGMAHVLLAVAGFNFARFQLNGPPGARLRRQLRTIARVVVPSVAVIGFAFAVTDSYTWANVFLLNTVLGPEGWTDYSRFWFVEILVHILLGLAALLAIPKVGRAERRWPLAFPLALFGADLLLRFRIIDLPYPGQGPVLWLFALGWAAAVSRTLRARAAVTALAVLTIPGAFDDGYRNATILAGFLALLWLPTLPVPRALHRITGLLASASLYAYVTHWLVYPLFDQTSKALAVAVSLAVGIGYWAIATRAMNAAERWLRALRERPRDAQNI